jgi:DNA-binding NtrC family response regulator
MLAYVPKILVVDEDRSALLALAELLRTAGYEVATAATDLDASLALETFRPEVVLTEVRLPGVWPTDVPSNETIGAQRVLMSVTDVPRELNVPWIKKPIDLTSLLDLLRKLTGPSEV